MGRMKTMHQLAEFIKHSPFGFPELETRPTSTSKFKLARVLLLILPSKILYFFFNKVLS